MSLTLRAMRSLKRVLKLILVHVLRDHSDCSVQDNLGKEMVMKGRINRRELEGPGERGWQLY